MKSKYYFLLLAFFVAIMYLIGFKNKSKAYKIFSIYLIVLFILDFISKHLYSWFKMYNHFFINIIFLIQYGLLSIFYSYSFESKKWRNIVEISLILVLTYLIIKYSIYPETFFVFHYQDIYITIFPLIVYGMVYLYNEYDKPQELYYANLALLIHFIINFFCYLSWPLQSISIYDNYMIEFGNVFSRLNSLLTDITAVIYSIILLYQLKKLKSK